MSSEEGPVTTKSPVVPEATTPAHNCWVLPFSVAVSNCVREIPPTDTSVMEPFQQPTEA